MQTATPTPARGRRKGLLGARVALTFGPVLVVPFLRTPVGDDPEVYRAMFDQAADGRFVLDGHFHILHANRAATQLFRASETLLRGVVFSELIAAESRAEFTRALAVVHTPSSRFGPAPYQGRASDGSTFPVDVEVVHGTTDRYGIVTREARPPTSSPPSGRLTPGRLLIADRIEELV